MSDKHWRTWDKTKRYVPESEEIKTKRNKQAAEDRVEQRMQRAVNENKAAKALKKQKKKEPEPVKEDEDEDEEGE